LEQPKRLKNRKAIFSLFVKSEFESILKMAEETNINKNVAQYEYDQYCNHMHNQMKKLVSDLFSQEFIHILCSYLLSTPCEHFEMIVSSDKIFRFVWKFNTLLAQRNWAHDLHSPKTFLVPEHITYGSILAFNESPQTMLLHAFSDEWPLPLLTEDQVVSCFRKCAAVLRSSSV
jgi:hypothetical protein